MSDLLILKCKKKNIIFQPELKIITLKGDWGKMIRCFDGKDIIYFSDRVFIRSKQSYQFFKNYFKLNYETVNYGYFVRLDLVGLGFRFLKIENFFLIKVGYSHYLRFEIPEGLHVVGFKRRFFIFGVDKNKVRNFANQIRAHKKPDAYKGKGILYANEVRKLKVGKQK